MTHVLCGYPLSAGYKSRLESVYGTSLIYWSLGELRATGIRAALRTLRADSPDRVLLAIEDEQSQAIVPILKAAAAFTRANTIELVDAALTARRISRWHTVSAAFKLTSGTISAWKSMRRCQRQLEALIREPRHDYSFDDNNDKTLLYLKSNLWFGLKAGGSVGHVAGVINAFARRGYHIDFCSLEEPTLLDKSVKWRPITLSSRLAFLPELNLYPAHEAFVNSLSSTLTSSRPAFIYQRLSLGNFAGPVLSRNFKLPLIIEYNGSEVWVQKNWGRSLRFSRVAQLAESTCLKHAHLVVTISNVLRDELIARGVDRHRIITYPNCIDPQLFNPERFTNSDRAELLREHKIPTNATVAMFLGTFGQWHGAEVLATAIRTLALEMPDWLRATGLHFMLVGDGARMRDVKRILEDSRCSEFYTLTGLVPQASGPRYLAAADILVSPHVPNSDGSKFFGSPTKLFEYMAMGKAIIASDLDQIGDVLRNSLSTDSLPTTDSVGDDSVLAVLAPPANVGELIQGLRFLTTHPGWRSCLGRNARREALRKYTWDDHVEAIVAGFQSAGAEFCDLSRAA